MRRGLIYALMLVTLIIGSTVQAASKDDEPLIDVINDGISHSESVYPYEGGLLISNFGSETIEPRKDENKGYILYYRDGQMSMLIPPEGRLHKPTAMLIKDGFLYVCDSDKLKIFAMDDLKAEPRVINFPTDDKVVNDLAISENKLYITVTNTGRIYTLDISNPQDIGSPTLWLDKVPGPNGIAIYNNMAYIVSIPVDYETMTPNNVIYRVKNINNPTAERFVSVPGLYDGAAISEDGKYLYVTDWKTGTVTRINVSNKKSKIIYREDGIGPASLAVFNDKLYVPDLVNSRILILPTR